MAYPRMSAEKVQEAVEAVKKYGNVNAASQALGIPHATLNKRYKRSLQEMRPEEQHPTAATADKATFHVPQRRHFIIPDTQVRPGVPLDHLDWVAKAIVHYKPDVVIHLGDHWDFPSLNSHEEPGSAPMEGKRYYDDLVAGNEAFARISKPMDDEMKRDKAWKPRRIFIPGNHENRADRASQSNPKFLGTIGSDNCNTLDWERFQYLQVVEIDGVHYTHFFQSSHSSRPIGGTALNRLNKIGGSFVQGHVQGLDMGTKLLGSGETWWGIVAGSCYLHIEDYRGAQGQRHWRGVIVLNEVHNGEFCPMPLTLNYLCRRNTGMPLREYMVRQYPYQGWEHLE